MHVINQSFITKHKWPTEIHGSETVLALVKTGVADIVGNIHLAFSALGADLVALPAPAAFLSTALKTPSATTSCHKQQK